MMLIDNDTLKKYLIDPAAISFFLEGESLDNALIISQKMYCFIVVH